MEYKFKVYNKNTDLVQLVYDIKIMNEEQWVENIEEQYATLKNINTIKFLVYDKKEDRWGYEDSSRFKEYF